MHKEVLQQLISYSGDLNIILLELSSYGWDFEEAVIILTHEHILSILERYLSGELTQQQLEDWGNAIEGREDIDYEEAYEEHIADAIHHLANPLLTEPITSDSVRNVISTF